MTRAGLNRRTDGVIAVGAAPFRLGQGANDNSQPRKRHRPDQAERDAFDTGGVARVLQRVRHGSVAHQCNGHPCHGKQWNADSHDRERDERKPRAFPEH